MATAVIYLGVSILVVAFSSFSSSPSAGSGPVRRFGPVPPLPCGAVGAPPQEELAVHHDAHTYLFLRPILGMASLVEQDIECQIRIHFGSSHSVTH